MNKTIFVIALIALNATVVSAFKMPEAICKPATAVSKVIVDHAMACAMKEHLPKSVSDKTGALVQTASKYIGMLGLGKMNFVDKMRSGQEQAVAMVEDKLLAALGCPVQKRRLGLWDSVKNGASSIGSGLSNAASYASHSAKNAATMSGAALIKASHFAAIAAKKAAADTASGLNKAADFAAATAKIAATNGAEVMKQYGGVISTGACVVTKKLCAPACVKAGDSLKDALNAYKISETCMKEAFSAGCATLCSTVCARRALKITKRRLSHIN